MKIFNQTRKTTKIRKKLFLFGILFVSLLVTFFHINQVEAQSSTPTVTTTGYSSLSPSVFILQGAYSGNTERKPFTSYFEFKRNNSNLDVENNREETIKIVRNQNVEESGIFHTNPEFKLVSTYYFRAVSYFNDTPSQKFYGSVLSLQTGYVPIGSTRPFSIEASGNVVTYVPPVCNTQTQELVNGLCKNKTPETCTLPQVLSNLTGTCVTPPPPSCTSPKVLNAARTACVNPNNSTNPLNPINPNNPTNPALDPDPEMGLVPCDGTDKDKCEFGDIMTLINKVINFILYALALPIAAIMFAYAGFLLVTSGGSTENRGKAKNIFTNTAIGFIIALAAFLIIQLVLTTLGHNGTWIGF